MAGKHQKRLVSIPHVAERALVNIPDVPSRASLSTRYLRFIIPSFFLPFNNNITLPSYTDPNIYSAVIEDAKSVIAAT